MAVWLWAAAIAVSLVSVAGALAAGPVRLRQHGVECSTTRSHLFGANSNRVEVRLMNVSSETIWIGGADTAGGPVLNTGNGWPIHAASQLSQAHAFSLMNFEGGLECITGTGTAIMKVLETFR